MTNTVLLSGVLSVNVGDGVSSVTIKGRWTQPGESSYQQFRLSRTGEPGGELLDGEEHSFSGSFDFDGGVVEENGVKMSFAKKDEGMFALRGRGNNGIGAFLLQGTATPSSSDSTYNVKLEKYYIGVGDRVARYRSGNGEAPRILTGVISHGQEGGSCYKVFYYKDGAVEEMDGKEIVEKFIFIDKEGHPTKAPCHDKSFKKGLDVLMYFLVQDQPKPYSGKVTRYDAEADLYSILFEDGEELKLEPEIVAEIVVSKWKGPKPIRTKKKATDGKTYSSAPPSKGRGSENKGQVTVAKPDRNPNSAASSADKQDGRKVTSEDDFNVGTNKTRKISMAKAQRSMKDASDKSDTGVNVSSDQTNVDVAGVDATEDDVAVSPKKASIVLDSGMKTSLVSGEEMEQAVVVAAAGATSEDGDIVASNKDQAFTSPNDGGEVPEEEMTVPPTDPNEAVESVNVQLQIPHQDQPKQGILPSEMLLAENEEVSDGHSRLQSTSSAFEPSLGTIEAKCAENKREHRELRAELEVQSSKIASCEEHSLEEANRHDKMESEQQRLNGAIKTVSADQAKLVRAVQASEARLSNQEQRAGILHTMVRTNRADIVDLTSTTNTIGEDIGRVAKILPTHASKLAKTDDALQELRESCARRDDRANKERQRLRDDFNKLDESYTSVKDDVSALYQEVSGIAKNTEANTEDIEALKVGHKTQKENLGNFKTHWEDQWTHREEQWQHQLEERNLQDNYRNHAIQNIQSELPFLRGGVHNLHCRDADKDRRLAYLEAQNKSSKASIKTLKAQVSSLLSSKNSGTDASTSGKTVAVVDPDPNHNASKRKKPSADGGGAPSNPNKKSRKLVWGATIRNEPS